MINRRLLRVKVMQALYAYLQTDSPSVSNSEKELHFSINKSYELYISLFLLLTELVRYARLRIDIAREKKIPGPDDLNPNTRFVDNPVIAMLGQNSALKTFVNNTKISWSNRPELIRSLYNQMAMEDFYREYMGAPETSFEEDKKFTIALLNDLILPSDEFYNTLEEQSIYWNDEVDYLVNIAGKTIRKMKKTTPSAETILPLYKNEEDAVFAKKLFRKVIVNQKDYEKLIEQYTRNWDFERIAFMDILLLMMAIAEIQEFESIPVKVSFNEYIEISKLYSTEKSSIFINGILDKIIQHLREHKLFVKKGRGLIGEN